MMSFRTECKIFLKVPLEQKTKRKTNIYVAKGEVDSGSILTKKQETKAYWETKMLPVVDDSGWEPVANVKFRSDAQNNNVEEADSPSAVPPPPEFSAPPAAFEVIPPPVERPEEDLPALEPSLLSQGAPKNERPTRQYVYGADDDAKPKKVSHLTTTRSSSHENIIEAEIREQQMREEALKKENDLRNREKSGGASSPSSHTSDEGFVDRPLLLEELPTSSSPPPLTLSPSGSLPLTPPSHLPEGGFTHTLKGHDGEPVIYDAVSPPAESFIDKTLSPCGGSSEAKIALEIRELKEREAELRTLRELREREQELRAMKNCISQSRSNPSAPEAEEENEEEVERASSSSREPLDENLTSLTTTTDEGNYSECGDAGSSEDKSSDGSNSRMMSPDLNSFGHSDSRTRKVTVKPFEDEDNEAEPVYTQMKKESVIEREIRLAREREEAFRREKGLAAPSPASPKIHKVSAVVQSSSSAAETPLLNGVDKTSKVSVEAPKRGVQHRLATTRIQQEIEETAQRERELRSAGKIRTLSEDTVDSKVTRLTDLVSDQESCSTKTPSSISSASSFSSLNSSPSRSTAVNGHTPLFKRTSSPVSPYSPPCFTPSPANRLNAPTRLTRSQSTNNISFTGSPTPALRVPQRGLMQKFIASRGKMTGSAFAPSTSPSSGSFSAIKPSSPVTSNGITTRPMKISPKAPIIRRETEIKEEKQPPKIYRRTHTTAEEKIQEELREMKKREEELRRLRARNLARSQPNLAGIDDDADLEDATSSDGVDSSSFLHEMNGLRTALSNPNLLDDAEQTTSTPQAERGSRRRSALIAQWEGRIQQTTES